MVERKLWSNVNPTLCRWGWDEIGLSIQTYLSAGLHRPTRNDRASTMCRKPYSLHFLGYHNLTVTSSSRLESTSQHETSSSKLMPSRVIDTDDMLLNSASGSRSSGSLVRNCAADIKSMFFSSSWYKWRMPAIERMPTVSLRCLINSVRAGGGESSPVQSARWRNESFLHVGSWTHRGR